MLQDGQLLGGNLVKDKLRRDQVGRVGYDQYAAHAMMLFGFDTYRAYNAQSHLRLREVEGQPIPVVSRLRRNITPAFTLS